MNKNVLQYVTDKVNSPYLNEKDDKAVIITIVNAEREIKTAILAHEEKQKKSVKNVKEAIPTADEIRKAMQEDKRPTIEDSEELIK